MDLKPFIRDVPDFPKPGIVFKDITPLLSDPIAFGSAIDQMAEQFQDMEIDAIVAAEARGFVFGAPLALKLDTAFVPVRKPGKLPFETRAFTYELEYGSDTLEIHIDGVGKGQRVLVVDDLLATGGTVEACCELIEQSGANVVGCAFLIELAFLEGAKKLNGFSPFSLIRY